ncbi:CTB family bacteriocin [Nostoc sp. CCY0012]|uniref:CTB family bacteriocin n=1 Tax=Nostoc sp. CCY0012 TaxID=1056123 RepID=UPI0039C73E51
MSNQLFTEVSVEQQEIVAGGVDLGVSFTAFQTRIAALQTASASGPAGSVAGGTGASVETITAGLNIIALGV